MSCLSVRTLGPQRIIQLIIQFVILQNFEILMNTLWDIGMAIGPSIGYLYQAKIINDKKSIGSFSIDLCGIILFANIMRVNFYIFNQYQITLLLQSLILISTQVFLIYLCTKYRIIKIIKKQDGEEEIISKQKFWRWKYFSTYCLIILLFTSLTLLASITFYNMQLLLYGQAIGFVALLSESVLIVPQIIQIFRKHSVQGISNLLLSLNFIGDLLKVGYFFARNQPIQFKSCGIIQIFLDFFIICQVVFYRVFRKTNDDQNIDIKEMKAEELHQQIQMEVKTENQQLGAPTDKKFEAKGTQNNVDITEDEQND